MIHILLTILLFFVIILIIPKIWKPLTILVGIIILIIGLLYMDYKDYQENQIKDKYDRATDTKQNIEIPRSQ